MDDVGTNGIMLVVGGATLEVFRPIYFMSKYKCILKLMDQIKRFFKPTERPAVTN
jgi:hypothetical protein